MHVYIFMRYYMILFPLSLCHFLSIFLPPPLSPHHSFYISGVEKGHQTLSHLFIPYFAWSNCERALSPSLSRFLSLCSLSFSPSLPLLSFTNEQKRNSNSRFNSLICLIGKTHRYAYTPPLTRIHTR